MKNAVMMMVVLGMAGMASATISGVFVPATTLNTGPAGAITNTGDWTTADNLWDTSAEWKRSGVPVITTISAINAETVPMVTTTVGGLNPARTYEIFVQYVGLSGAVDWSTDAALHANPLVNYNCGNSTDTGILPHDYDAFRVYEHSLGTVSGVSSFQVDIGQGAGKIPHYAGVSYLVPEPASLVLLGLGGWLLRRRF